MKKFGLIGERLEHSFSETYFKEKFTTEGYDYLRYLNCEVSGMQALEKLLRNSDFLGFNVTIPYKERIIPLLDELSEGASKMLSVNTLCKENGEWKGYNTDCIGLERALQGFYDCNLDKMCLILGSGGASKAAAYVCKEWGKEYLIVSRSPCDEQISYPGIAEYLEKSDLIINTTPLGMFPTTDEMPDIPVSQLNEKHFVFDMIYNPRKTLLLSQCERFNANVKNGYDMLIEQAEASFAIWSQILDIH